MIGDKYVASTEQRMHFYIIAVVKVNNLPMAAVTSSIFSEAKCFPGTLLYRYYGINVTVLFKILFTINYKFIIYSNFLKILLLFYNLPRDFIFTFLTSLC